MTDDRTPPVTEAQIVRRVRAARVSRRAFFALVGTASLTAGAVTAGQSFPALGGTNLVAPRVAGLGPQRLPVNKTAVAAGVVEAATDRAWRLRVGGPAGTTSFSRAELLGLPQSVQELPIACVEGWTTYATWVGVPLAALLALVGGSFDRHVRLTSLEPGGAYRVTTMGPEFATDPRTLVALGVNDEPLDLDHGYPARIIAPARPGVLQTKWLARVEVLS